MQPRSRALILITFFALGIPVAVAAQDLRAPQPVPEPGESAAPFIVELGAGALIGLDRPARGGVASAGIVLDLAAVLGPGFDGVVEGVQAAFLYDASLSAPVCVLDLVLGLGPELRLLLGCECPLSAPVLSVEGFRYHIATRALPNHVAVLTTLASWPAQRRGQPALRLNSNFGWSAYAHDPSHPEEDAQSAARCGIRGFAAGFRLGLLLALRWGGNR